VVAESECGGGSTASLSTDHTDMRSGPEHKSSPREALAKWVTAPPTGTRNLPSVRRLRAQSRCTTDGADEATATSGAPTACNAAGGELVRADPDESARGSAGGMPLRSGAVASLWRRAANGEAVASL
jgi:hypothetical protein